MSKTSERAVLASILFWPDAILRARDAITPDSFLDLEHRSIYTAMLSCADNRDAPDILNVTAELDRQGSTIPASTVTALMNEPVTPPRFDSYLETLVRETQIHHAVKALNDARDAILHDRTADPQAVLQRIASNLPLTTTSAGPVPFSELAADVLARLDEQQQGTWEEHVTPSGFPTLDRMLGGGFRPGELVVLAGRPGMAKTAMALALAKNAARSTAPALMFSLEMSGLSIFERAVADAAGLSMDVVRSRKLSPDHYRLLSNVARLMAKVPVHVDDTSGLTTEQAMVRTQRFLANNPCSLVVADYLEIMGDKDDNAERRAGEISLKMKHLARANNVPVVLLAQLNRAVEMKRPPIPALSHLRQSGSIEANADVVLMLYRNDYYVEQDMADADDSRRDTCEVFVRKQRNGQTGTVTLGFRPDTMSFTDPTDAPPSWAQEAAD